MFEYLVVSNTRRALLKLLWLEGVRGTVHELARAADVAYAGAYRELKQMADAGLARIAWERGKKVYSANEENPGSRLLRKLMNQPVNAPVAEKPEPSELRSELASLGLPVFSDRAPSGTRRKLRLETALVEAANLAESDASVARALPVLLFRVGTRVDYDALKRESRLADNSHRVGFFLELAGMLGNDAKMRQAAGSFFDHRRKGLRPFFSNQSKHSGELALERTPEVARKWGWTMNMGFDAFESTFRKFVDGSIPA